MCVSSWLIMFLNMLVDMVISISIHFDYCPLHRSGDSTARIWTVADGASGSSSQNGPSNVLVLKHVKGRINEKNKDVTTLDWNVSSSVATLAVFCCVDWDEVLNDCAYSWLFPLTGS